MVKKSLGILRYRVAMSLSMDEKESKEDEEGMDDRRKNDGEESGQALRTNASQVGRPSSGHKE